MFHPSNLKLNAAGLSPENSQSLPERQPEGNEEAIIKAINDLYSLTPTPALPAEIFAPELIFTLPSGAVSVGLSSVQSTFQANFQAHPSRQLIKQRLLSTPDTLLTTAPNGTSFILLDQEIAFFDEEAVNATMDASADDVLEIQMEPKRIVRSLIVAKRRSDGLVTSMSEEEDHKKATAPLATRAASLSNSFYSPSDSVVSPCTSKLNLAKKKHYMKGKPTSLFGKPAKSSGLINSPIGNVSSHAQQPPRSGLSHSTNAADMSF